jgi:hypothetical protein
MSYFLSYYNDTIASDTTANLPDAKRMIFVWKGSCSVSGMLLEAGMAAYCEGDAVIEASHTGAMLFRWDLSEGDAKDLPAETIRLGSMLRMSRELWSIEITTGSEWLFRLDLINNPPGQVADVHTHPGPGIRALLSGSFSCRQPSEDGSADCPGDPWWETGVEAVISTPHDTEISKFLRCMILPLELKGKGNSGVWYRKKIQPPPGWPIWTLLVDQVVKV